MAREGEVERKGEISRLPPHVASGRVYPASIRLQIFLFPPFWGAGRRVKDRALDGDAAFFLLILYPSPHEKPPTHTTNPLSCIQGIDGAQQGPEPRSFPLDRVGSLVPRLSAEGDGREGLLCTNPLPFALTPTLQDNALRELVEGKECKSWHNVSSAMVDRTEIDCFRRWQKVGS